MTTPAVTPPPRSSSRVLRAVPLALFDILRGALIGIAELLPGISGGTVALITGVYERLLNSASRVVSAVKVLIFGPHRRAGFVREFRAVDWRLLIPVVVGMIAMVLTLAGLIEGLVSSNAEMSRGLFFGLVAASIVVPLQLVPRIPRTVSRRLLYIAVFVAAAALAFTLTDLSGGSLVSDPPLWIVFVAAAVAVCALVVPGVSGSFFLLAIGLYSPTLIAVDERDLGYLAVFALGALVGLVTIVRFMSWLLKKHRALTLIAMAGLMLGSLRALWPWQAVPGDSHGIGAAVAPYDPVAGPMLLALLGAAFVFALIVVEGIFQRRAAVAAVARGAA